MEKKSRVSENIDMDTQTRLKFEITIPQVDPHLLYFRQLLSTIYIAKYGDWMKPFFMEAGSDSTPYLMVKIFRFASWGCELGNYLKMG